MSTKSAIALAQLLGVTLSVLDGKIVAKPSSAVTGLLRQEVRAHKDELLIILGAAHETAHTDTATRSERQRACVLARVGDGIHVRGLSKLPEANLWREVLKRHKWELLPHLPDLPAANSKP